MRELTELARKYHALGMSLIPIAPRTKKPPRGCRWKKCQQTRMELAELLGWLQGPPRMGLGVVLGPISAGLAARDYDDLQSYENWRKDNCELARRLPTSITRRGRHVFFRSTRPELRKSSDGELRGRKSYVVLPPSLGENGHHYRWEIEPTESNLLEIDPYETGLWMIPPLPFLSSEESASSPTPPNVFCVPGNQTEFIRRYLPTGPGQRNRCLWELARGLRARLDGGPEDCRQLFDLWYDQAEPVIRTRGRETNWREFCRQWNWVVIPEDSFLDALIEELDLVIGRERGRARERILASCMRLQERTSPHPFYLSARTAARLGACKYAYAARTLRNLAHENILQVISPGKRGLPAPGEILPATRYRLLRGYQAQEGP